MLQAHSNWFYSSGSYNYVLTDFSYKDSEGNNKTDFLMIRLVNINGLKNDVSCKEVVSQLKGGLADLNGDGVSDDEAYQNFTDVYGVTDDLQVYYCQSGLETANGADYKNASFLDGTKVVYSSSSNVSNAIAETLEITASEQTLTSLRSNQELVVSSTSGLTDLEFLQDMPNIKKLTLRNYVGSLKGIERAYKLTYLYFDNSGSVEQNITNYNSLAACTKLSELYFFKPTNAEVEKICTGMQDTDYISLATIGFYGRDWLPNASSAANIDWDESHSELDTLISFDKLSSKTKSAVKVLYLNNNKLKNLNGIQEYTNVTFAMLQSNYLNDISVLSKLVNLTSLNLMNNYPIEGITEGITDISALDFCTRLSICSIWRDFGIISLKTFVRPVSDGKNSISILRADGNIPNLDFSTNTTYWTNDNKNILTAIDNLYLDASYSLVFAQKEIMNLATTVTDEEFKSLANNAYIVELLVTNNKNIKDSTFQLVLPTLPKLRCLDVSGTNIESLNFITSFTENQKKYFNSIVMYNSKITNLKGLELCPNLTTVCAWGNDFHLVSTKDLTIKENSTIVLNIVGSNYDGGQSKFYNADKQQYTDINPRQFKSLSVSQNYCTKGYLPGSIVMCNEMGQLTDLKYLTCYTNSTLLSTLDLRNTSVEICSLRHLSGSNIIYLPETTKTVSTDSAVAPIRIASDKNLEKIDLKWDAGDVGILKHIEEKTYKVTFSQLNTNQMKAAQSLFTIGVNSFNHNNSTNSYWTADWSQVDYSACTLLTSMSFKYGRVINLDCSIFPNTLTTLAIYNSQIQKINNFSRMNSIVILYASGNSFGDVSFLQEYFKYDESGNLYCDSPIVTLDLRNNVLGDSTTMIINGRSVTNYTSYFLSLMPQLKTVYLSGNDDLKTINYLTDAGFSNNNKNFSK